MKHNDYIYSYICIFPTSMAPTVETQKLCQSTGISGMGKHIYTCDQIHCNMKNK